MDDGIPSDRSFPSLEGFDRLVRRKRERGLGPTFVEADGRAEVTVVREDWPRWLEFTSGVVIIDQKRGGILVGGRPRRFTMHAGEHSLAVRIGSETVAIRSLLLKPGEHVEFVCGLGAPRQGPGRARSGAWRWPRGKLAVFAYAVGAYVAGTLGFVFLILMGLGSISRRIGYSPWTILILWAAGPLLGIAAWVRLAPTRWLARAVERPYLVRIDDGPPPSVAP